MLVRAFTDSKACYSSINVSMYISYLLPCVVNRQLSLNVLNYTIIT